MYTYVSISYHIIVSIEYNLVILLPEFQPKFWYVWGFLSFPKKTSSWLSMIGLKSGQEGRRSQPYPIKKHFPQKIWISVPHKSWKDILNKNTSLVIHPGKWIFLNPKMEVWLRCFSVFFLFTGDFQVQNVHFPGCTLPETNKSPGKIGHFIKGNLYLQPSISGSKQKQLWKGVDIQTFISDSLGK